MSLLGTFLRRLFARGARHLPKPGEPAPDFEASDQLGRRVRLSELRGKRVVLWFYPKADTPGCTKQMCGFRDGIGGYLSRGIEVLGISVDAPEANRAFAQKFGASLRLLSDPDRKVSLAYGAVDGASDAYARRITFVIGPDGRIEQAIETKDPAGQAGEILKSL